MSSLWELMFFYQLVYCDFFFKVGNTQGKIQGRKFVFKKMDLLLFSPCFVCCPEANMLTLWFYINIGRELLSKCYLWMPDDSWDIPMGLWGQNYPKFCFSFHCFNICSESAKAMVGKTADILAKIKAVSPTALVAILFLGTCLFNNLCYEVGSTNTVFLLYKKVQKNSQHLYGWVMNWTSSFSHEYQFYLIDRLFRLFRLE